MQALQAKIDEITASLEEAQGAFTDIKASFQDDPLALTPWMNALFDTADLGVTTFSAAGRFWPRAPLSAVLSTTHGAEASAAAEKVLGAFRKRYAAERGAAAAPQIIFRISPNALRTTVTEDTITDAVTRLMEAAGVDPEADAPEPLDAVELCWWEGSGESPVRVLRQLGEMCREVTEVDEESGEVTVTAPRKIRALGVYGFSARCEPLAASACRRLCEKHPSEERRCCFFRAVSSIHRGGVRGWGQHCVRSSGPGTGMRDSQCATACMVGDALQSCRWGRI